MVKKELKKAYAIIDALYYDEGNLTQWQHELLTDVIRLAEQKTSKPDISKPIETCVKTIRENFEMWRKGEIKDGVLSFHLNNNLLRLEKQVS